MILTQLAAVAGVVAALAGLFLMASHRLLDLVPLLAVSIPGVAALFWATRALAEADDYPLLIRVVMAGLLLRLGLGLVIHYMLPVWFFAPDQFTYQDVGWRTLLFLQGRGPSPWQIQGSTEVGYFYWNALLFWVFGNAPIVPKIVNAFVGTASAVVAYRIAGELAGREPARWTAVLTMFFPSLVLWSTQNLRDPVVLLVTALLFLSALRLRVRPSAWSFLGIVLALTTLLLLRDYIAVMALFALVGASVLARARSLPASILVGAALFGLAVIAYQQFGLGARWVESASFEAISEQRNLMAFGGTAFRPEVDVSTPLRGLGFLPIGLAFFLLSPFPWQVGSALSAMTLPEQIVWYALVPMVFVGARYLIRERVHAFGPILVFLALTTSVYALVEGNAGTAYRHRAQVLVFFLIVASVGLAVRGVRRRNRGRGRRAAAHPPAGAAVVDARPR